MDEQKFERWVGVCIGTVPNQNTAGQGDEGRTEEKRGVLLCIGLEARPVVLEWVGGSVHWNRAKPEHVVVSGGRHPLHPPPIHQSTGRAGGGREGKKNFFMHRAGGMAGGA
eukprot:scaffold7762_cov107-Isochrysis_galbana.AAC.1